MEPKDAVLFERVIWVNALMRYFKNKPTAAVPDALGLHVAHLDDARAALHDAFLEATARGGVGLSNRQAAELGRATVAIAMRKPTLDDVRQLRAELAPDGCALPDVAKII